MVKRKILSILIVLGLLVVLVAIPAQAATEEEIENSIQEGIDWLVPEQIADGSWPGGNRVASTGLAVLKLLDRGYELAREDPEIDGPFDTDYIYKANIEAGLDFLFKMTQPVGIGLQPAGDPDSEGDGVGISIWHGYPTYETGIAMMAIASTRESTYVVGSLGSAVDGWTYQRVVQNAVDYLAFGQNDAAWPRGGWGYGPNQDWSDNSNTGYAVLGLRYAEDFGCSIPGFVKTELDIWINYIQCNPGDPGYVLTDDGGSGYTSPGDGLVNCLKTGNLLFEMSFVGDDKTTARAQRAIAYIVRHWNDPNQNPGWRHHYQAMYCVMKGLESMVIIEPGDFGGIDWFDEMSTDIVAEQNPDGAWRGGSWGDDILNTEWALLTLERVVPNRPPDCSEAYAEPACLWSPNHKFVDVSIMGVTDPDDDPVTITITAITSDEPTASDKGSGGAKHAPDADGIGTDTASVRAERSGNGDGRVYVIHFTASDGRGGECEGSVIVKVPHDQSVEDCPAIDSGQNYDATEIN